MRFYKKYLVGGFVFILACLPAVASLFAEDDPGYEVSFIVEHPFKTVRGECGDLSWPGSVLPSIGRSATGEIKLPLPHTIECAVNSLHTGNANRDSHMLEVLQYPLHKVIRATVTSIGLAKSDPVPGVLHYSITGELEIAGQSRPFQSEVRTLLSSDGASINATGIIRVSLSEYGLEAPSLLGISVDDEVEVHYRFLFLVR